MSKRRGPIGITTDLCRIAFNFCRDNPGCAGIVIFWMLLSAAFVGILTSLGLGPLVGF